MAKKQLILVRHAKSSWANPGQNDIDRPLNDRGHRDAPVMAKRLLQKNIPINAFITSPAKRAFTTCTYFAETYGQKAAQVIVVPYLYLAEEADFIKAIQQSDDAFQSICIFAHNPGITNFANSLTNTRIDDMPTCAIFSVTANTNHWKYFFSSSKSYQFFDYPKLMP